MDKLCALGNIDWAIENLFCFFSIENKFQAEKRAHHNALERKRRDHIKDSFTALRDAVPSLQGEKVVSIMKNII